GRQMIDDGRACDGAAIAAERVVALLVGRDEENLASHCRLLRLSAVPSLAPESTHAEIARNVASLMTHPAVSGQAEAAPAIEFRSVRADRVRRRFKFTGSVLIS